MGVASLDLQQTDAGQGKIDYGNIINKPKINGITLEGDLSTEEIGIIIPTALSELENDTGFITSDVDDLVNYYDKETVDEKISLIPKFDIKVVQELPTEDISPTTLYLLVAEGDDHYVEYIYVDGEWDELGNGNIDLSDYTTYEYVDGELAKKANTVDLAAVATSGNYSDLSGTPTRLGQFTNDVGYITSAALPTKTSDLINDGEDGSSTYVENSDLATVATSGSYNDLTDKPTIDFELVEMSYGESNAWAKFIAAYRGHKIVYCRASSNSNPATGTQGRKAFMAYVNNAENPTEVEFQYVRSVSTKTSSQPVDQVYVYKLTSANGGTWTVQTRDMGPKLTQGANTTVSYSNGTYTISASQPTVNDATLTIQKNGTTVETFSANSSTNKTANITVPTKTSDVTNDSDFVNSTQVGNALAAYTYPSQDLYTQSDIDTMLAQISSLKIEVVNALPQTGNADTIYLLRVRQQGNDMYQEYFWVNNTWELIGGVDLTDYYTKTQTDTLLDAKADTSDIPTKTSDLTNDSHFPVDANYVHTDNNYTTTEKNKLAGIAAGAEVNVQSNWTQTNSSADDFIKNKPSIPTKTSDLTNDSGFITSAAIPTNVSAFNNDAGYLDSIPDDSVGLNQLDDTVVNALDRINDKANTADLAAVAFSGDYDDLSDKPTIPTVNNATLTIQKNGTNVQTFTANSSTNKTANITVPTKTSDITNDGSDGTSTYAETDDLATVATTGSYNDLVDKPTIPSGQIQSDWTQTNTSEVDYIKNKPTLATVATSGDYDDLTDKPTIGNATLTIQKNGTSAGTFTANATSNKTINITVPTTAADVSALPASTKYGASIAVSINTTDYKVTTTLKDQDGNTLGTAQVIDLPLESDVVSGSYDSTNKKIVLTLQSGATIDIPVGDLVAGLQTEITSTNKLSSDLVDDTNHTHKFVTAAQITKLNGIAAGAEVNVQSDWNQTTTTADDYIKNKPTLATVATSGSYNDLSNKPTIPAAQIQSDWTQTTTTAKDYIKNKPTLATVATSGSYNDLSNKPTIPTVNNATLTIQKNGTTVKTFTANASTNVTANITVPTKTSDITNDSNFVASGDLATVATSGSYNDLSNKPTIPAAQVQSNWTQTTTTAVDYIKNKPTLATVATSGSYNDLSNKPTIPAAQVNSDWNATSGKAQILNKPSLATVATSGSYNDLSNKPTIPAAQVQSNWTQTTTTAVDYIKNKPTLAAVATSGSYNDLSNKPTIPTVNNATLTIQKNGTNVQTFTANQSTNATANITVPTNTNELTNGAGFITSSGTAAKANQLTTARTIAISGGATGTATSFNGTSDISIPVTDVKDAYVTWGGRSLASNITPDDMGCIDEFGHNKLAFLPAECIEIKYSTDGGSTWVDYGASDANKVKMVSTAGPGFYVGGSTDNATASNIANLKLRVRIAAGPTSGGKIYTAAKKILINVSTQGCSGNKVDIKYRTIANYKAGTETWTTVGTYDVAGGSGWNSIPFAYTFGGSFTSQTSQMGQIEFVFYSSGLGTWGLKKLSAIDFRMIGSTNWTMPSEMARAGHLYTVDEGQNATFPANVSVTGSLKHGSYTYTLPNKTGTVAMTSDLPTVNNATLTIQKNGTNVQTFTANQGTNATANITVPTKTSDLTNDSNFVASTSLATVATSGSYNDLSNKPTIPTVNNATLTIQKNGTNVQTFTANQSTNATANITVPTKISDLTNTSGGFITYCTCSTAAATAAKVVTLDSGDSNWALRKGAIIGVKFTNSNTASSVTLNVNSSGAKSIYYNNAAYTGSSNSICGYANRYTFYMYDGTYWVWISDSRHDGNDNTYTTAYCSTAAGTAAKAASMTGYTLTANRYTVITFTNANSAASALTLNINGKGAKPLYINGAASSSSNYTLAAGSYIVYYNGTNYYINNNGEIPRMIHSESPVSTSAVTPIISNSMISNNTITFAKTATGEFLKLTLTTTDPGAGSALAANTLLGVYE